MHARGRSSSLKATRSSAVPLPISNYDWQTAALFSRNASALSRRAAVPLAQNPSMKSESPVWGQADWNYTTLTVWRSKTSKVQSL